MMVAALAARRYGAAWAVVKGQARVDLSGVEVGPVAAVDNTHFLDNRLGWGLSSPSRTERRNPALVAPRRLRPEMILMRIKWDTICLNSRISTLGQNIWRRLCHRTIPFLQHDPDRPEDIMTDSEDHAADEWRYACMSRPYVPTREKPKPQDLSGGYRVYREPAKPGDWKTY
jgi:hypothetical protein